MAASGSSSRAISANLPEDCSKSPLSHLPLDHLFSILLILPIDSILSFTMTCRRFRSLACSDTLWKSICRRDWGDASVDALQSSNIHSHLLLPWMKLYQQVSQLETVYCHQLTNSGSDLEVPRPRASHSLNFVSDCLVLYGGGCEGGRHLDDTWVVHVGNDSPRMLKWQRMISGIPNGRFGHTCVAIMKSLILFGGINDQGVRKNDTWVGQIAPHDSLRFTLSWSLLDVGGLAPPPRGAHAACSVDNNLMIIHGGIGPCGLRLSDTWVLEISENLHHGIWHEAAPMQAHPSPPARSGHSMTSVSQTRTVLFGGRGVGYEVLNDVWVLDLSEGSLRWAPVPYDLECVPEGGSLARVGHSATLVIGGRLLIHGGEDSDRRRKDDFWLLDVGEIRQPGHGKGKMWKRVGSRGFRSSRRSFHRACVDMSGCYLYVFGGMVDGLVQPPQAHHSGMRFDGDFFLVELLVQP